MVDRSIGARSPRGRNGSRRLLGIEEPGDIGLGDEADEEDDRDQKGDAREAVPHGPLPVRALLGRLVAAHGKWDARCKYIHGNPHRHFE